MKFIIEKLLEKQDLSQSESKNIMLEIMSGEYDDIQIAGFLVALRSKGAKSDEIAGFAEAMRKKMTHVGCVDGAIDMCGTGGDSSGTFNISTAASFLVAAAGVPVAKHGNRSMTSKSGSADVLEAMGINISLSIENVSECIDKIGIGFMFAPSLHPAMKHAMGARKSLGVRTVFNVLGPLCNPAGVRRQLMGIYNGDLTEIVANVFKRLGSINAMIVHGDDGLDEISTTAKTKISHLQNTGEIISESFSALEYGFSLASLEDLKGGSPELNAKIIQDILSGNENGKKTDIVILNAAAGILVGGKVESINDGIDVARDMISSGASMDVLHKLMAVK